MAWLLNSRWRVLLVAASLLLVLDLGRSGYARLGYAEPNDLWDGAPYDARLAWPPAANVPAGAPLGQQVYVERCAVCHGLNGDGRGAAAPSMFPRPRDFTLGQFKYKTTPAGQPPSDADLIGAVTNGLQASAMPYFGDILGEQEIRAVVDYVKAFSPVFEAPAPEPLAIPARVPPDEASLARGQAVFDANCASCHGADGRTRAELKDANGFSVYTRDLTAPWTFRGGSAPEQLWLRVTTGLGPSPMPSFAETLTADQRWDVVNYVLAVARPAPWESGGTLAGPGYQADPVLRGEYLVHAEMCGLCHTQISAIGIYRGDDYYLAGGMRVGAYPHGMFVSRNLTSDPETGLGGWTEAEVADAIRNGRARGRTLNFWGMPWMLLHNLNDDDALAIASYLKSQPPVANRIPAPLHYGVLETIAVKLTRPLPAVQPEMLTFAEGNFGQTGAGLPRDLPQSLLIAGQWLVLAAGLAAFVYAGPPERRFPRSARAWLGAGLMVFGLAACGLVGGALYGLPALSLLPPEVISENASAGIPEPEPGGLGGPEQAALAERGRYLYTVASCALCHGNSGAGGSKISWQSFGSLWSRNITSHAAYGLGAWTDAEIARAIRSGISRDGRALHWQGMIWDHASNWDEEDVAALVAYLRTLPPIDYEVPEPRAPQAGDCAVYSFWIVESRAPGCR